MCVRRFDRPGRICKACHGLQVNLNPPPGPSPPPAAVLLGGGPAVARRPFDETCSPVTVTRRRRRTTKEGGAPSPLTLPLQRPRRPLDSRRAGPTRRRTRPGSPTHGQSVSGRSGFESPSQHAGRRIGLRRRAWPDGEPGPCRWRPRPTGQSLAVSTARGGAACLVPVPGPTAATRSTTDSRHGSTVRRGMAPPTVTTAVRVRLSTRATGHHAALAAQAAGGRTAAGQPASGPA